MDIKRINDIVVRLMDEPGGNYVSKAVAIRPDVAGMRMYDFHDIGVASPDDDYFTVCRDPKVIGPHFIQPLEWLPEARSVISIFLAFTPKVMDTNAATKLWPSDEWLHARVEGQAFINSMILHLKDELEQSGYPSVVPSSDPCFSVVNKSTDNKKLSGLSFTSVWSERHVAFACGLGTFGLSKGLITRHGVAGRFASIVTALELPVTERVYSGVYDYCTACGACVINCPVDAISIETGKDHQVCSSFLDGVKEKHKPHYGCGKCQVKVPCQRVAPGA